MGSQKGFFDEKFAKKIESKYSSKVATPIYEPKEVVTPRLHELFDNRKARKLIKEIKAANISEKEKDFLIDAAHRHITFNYDKVAEYYCHASKEVQELMENSALVIIDFKKAVEKGYVSLSEEIADCYLHDYGDDIQTNDKIDKK